jgi:purine-nucleoside phosphorylase
VCNAVYESEHREMTMFEQVMEATAYVQSRSSLKPDIGVILGSGLGDLAVEVLDAIAIPYEEIPHFQRSTVVGHTGRLLIGKLENMAVVIMQGRFHFYEGYTMQALTLPVRVMHRLGVHTLIVTNAAGGLNPAYHPGDFMLIRDHINFPGLAGMNPLVGPNDERLGERFPALAKAYDAELRSLAHTIAAQWPEMTVHEGVYAQVAGPSYETGAELKFLRIAGADAVGMSTAPEVIVARHMGMRVLGISLITNTATGDDKEEVNHAEVLTAASAARTKFSALVRGILREMK